MGISAKFREPFSGLSHLAAAAAAAAGLAGLLVFGRMDALTTASVVLYGVSLILMFSASAAYHLVSARASVTLLLRRLDHSAIYLLIAGTYTPICLFFFSGFWKWGLLGVVWAIGLAGVAVKLFVIHSRRWVNAGIYLLMGWLGIAAIREMVTAMPAGALAWLAAGGLFFTVGALVYAFKWPRLRPPAFGFHEAWHLFVILGCLCHFIVIARYIALP